MLMSRCCKGNRGLPNSDSYDSVAIDGRTKGDFMAGMLPGVECARRRRFHQGGSLNLLHSDKDQRRSRRSSFCLYQSHQDHSTHDSHSSQPHWTTRPAMQPRTEQQSDDNRLHEAAREARERLDERLRIGSSSNRRRGSFSDKHSQQDDNNNHAHICEEGRRGVKCSEEEVWPTSIRGWLASVVSSTEVRRSAEPVKSSSMGLGKAGIDLLRREIFTSKEKTASGKYSWIKLSLRASQEEECPVCLESFEPGQVLVHLACAHRFHCNCLIPWLNTHSHCPCCRTKISIKAGP